MSILVLKDLTAAIIFIIGLCFGLWPILSQRGYTPSTLLIHGEDYARGIFLGAGLIHLLPDAIRDINLALPNHTYPIEFLICTSTIFGIQFIEQGLTKFFGGRLLLKPRWLSYFVATLLSIHSIIAGAALGFGQSVTGILIIFLAIIAHKGAAALSLGINMQRQHIERHIMVMIIVVFALMTPLGIVLGSQVNLHLQAHAAYLAQAIFSAIAAGTFIYIALFMSHYEETTTDSSMYIKKFIYLGCGIATMAIVAMWL